MFTVKVAAAVAGLYVELPAWVAVMVTLPTPVMLTVEPEIVAKPAVTAYVIGSPEVVVADTLNGGSVNVCAPIEENVMVCEVPATALKLCVTSGACPNVAFPHCDARTTTVAGNVPAVTVSKFPEICAGPETSV